MHTAGPDSLSMIKETDKGGGDMKKEYIKPNVKVVDMSFEGVLCMSMIFMLDSYEDGGEIDLDFTLF